jgi:hypothetical protein
MTRACWCCAATERLPAHKPPSQRLLCAECQSLPAAERGARMRAAVGRNPPRSTANQQAAARAVRAHRLAMAS